MSASSSLPLKKEKATTTAAAATAGTGVGTPTHGGDAVGHKRQRRSQSVGDHEASPPAKKRRTERGSINKKIKTQKPNASVPQSTIQPRTLGGEASTLLLNGWKRFSKKCKQDEETASGHWVAGGRYDVAAAFKKPVDIKQPGCEDYYKIITAANAVCLNDIRERQMDGSYYYLLSSLSQPPTVQADDEGTTMSVSQILGPNAWAGQIPPVEGDELSPVQTSTVAQHCQHRKKLAAQYLGTRRDLSQLYINCVQFNEGDEDWERDARRVVTIARDTILSLFLPTACPECEVEDNCTEGATPFDADMTPQTTTTLEEGSGSGSNSRLDQVGPNSSAPSRHSASDAHYYDVSNDPPPTSDPPQREAGGQHLVHHSSSGGSRMGSIHSSNCSSESNNIVDISSTRPSVSSAPPASSPPQPEVAGLVDHSACEKSACRMRSYTKCLRFLLRGKEEVIRTQTLQITTLQQQLTTRPHSRGTLQSERDETLKYLKGAGADLEAKTTQQGHTALLLAAQEGHTDAVKALKDVGAALEATCHDTDTVIYQTGAGAFDPDASLDLLKSPSTTATPLLQFVRHSGQ